MVDLAYVPLLIQYDLSVTVATQEWLEAALQQLTPGNTPLRVHLKSILAWDGLVLTWKRLSKQCGLFNPTKNFYGKGFLLIFNS